MNKNLIYLFTCMLFIALSSSSCQSSKATSHKEFPMFWTWLDYRSDINFDSLCREMNELGIEGVMLNAPTPEDYKVAIPIAKKYNIQVYAWLWTMNLEHDREKILKEHPEWFSVNRLGNSLADTTAYVGYYKFLCPILPEVQEYIKAKVKSYAEIEGLDGISIDYHRFVDVVLPTTLWPKYGIVQDREYPEWDFGYHAEMIKRFQEEHGYDPREQEDPSKDTTWRQFRCDRITDVANMIADVVHEHGKTMAASPFPTPKMSARMVRQDWGKWNLDIVFPMVYHQFYTEDVSFIADCTIDNAKNKNPNTSLYCGIMANDSTEVIQAMDAALENGAQGIAIFTMRSLKSPEIKQQFKAYTDKAKALRKENGGIYPTKTTSKINKNPFENQHIMSRIEKRIQRDIQAKNKLKSSPTLSLSPYELVEEYDVTKRYKIEDKNSGQVFHITFYFYGDLLSGWDVKAI
ncbi:family 10 glycosylhydrolase [Sphingobacterium wenxiniae]|uniref:Glycosyl hydrolase-like 10 n=1 Tax=Sphingobacterium wenxiniae TaxID=683125 RepID=A0A1I6P5C1_9SPHI|nr:family 10 glycosylhydrolase [Sphingobacterium wenxiniae]SFS35270.1 Glycosyl hydrolase-like 10 [Sphingobacterium wenxiniae]